jgi:Putative Ig domain/FG-GAP repeat
MRSALRSLALPRLATAALVCSVFLATEARAALPQQAGAVELATQSHLSIVGAGPMDGVGASVANAGDVNGDGIDDILLGAPSADRKGFADVGAAYVVFGSATPKTVDLRNLGGSGFEIVGGTQAERAGTSVAGVGDWNGDGRGDIAIGAPAQSSAAYLAGGVVSIVYGKSDGTTVNLAALSAGGFAINGVGRTGTAIARAGDMNGDGRPDLVIGAPERLVKGAVYVVYGRGGTDPIDLEALGNAGSRITGSLAGDLFGSAVAGDADLNGDRRPDIVATTPTGGRANVLVVTGPLPAGNSTSTGTDLKNAGVATEIYGPIGSDAPSKVALVSDMTGNATAEIAISYPTPDGSGRVIVTDGAAALAAGRATGLVLDGQLGENLGSALAGVGDLNGDGRGDLGIVGNESGLAGSVRVLLGSSRTGTFKIADLGGETIRLRGSRSGELTPAAIAGGGDINGDARPDVLVGAPGAEPGGSTDQGEAFGVLGFGPPQILSNDVSVVMLVGATLQPVSPPLRRTGAATFTVSPSLPPGLSLDPKTGAISGTPLDPSSKRVYTVTMTDLVGSVTWNWTITVLARESSPPPRAQADALIKNVRVGCAKRVTKLAPCRLRVRFTVSQAARVTMTVKANGTTIIRRAVNAPAGRRTILGPFRTSRGVVKRGVNYTVRLATNGSSTVVKFRLPTGPTKVSRAAEISTAKATRRQPRSLALRTQRASAVLIATGRSQCQLGCPAGERS